MLEVPSTDFLLASEDCNNYYSSFEFIKHTKTDVHMDNFVVKTLTVVSTEKK